MAVAVEQWQLQLSRPTALQPYSSTARMGDTVNSQSCRLGYLMGGRCVALELRLQPSSDPPHVALVGAYHPPVVPATTTTTLT